MSRRLGILALCLAILLGSLPGAYYAYRSGQEVATLKGNVCKVVAAQSKGNVAQHTFWIEAAKRARIRASLESNGLRAADLDSARNDERIAAVYAPSHFKFPGC